MKLIVGLLVAVTIVTADAGFLGFGDVEFIPYEGSQSHWETSPGANVDRSYKLPVYYGRPPRRYTVIGTVRVSGTGGFTKEVSAIRDAVSCAKKNGADALVLTDRGRDSSGPTVGRDLLGNFHVSTVTTGRAEGIAIRWVK